MTSEQSLNGEVHDIWNENAQFWDEQMGDEGKRWFSRANMKEIPPVPVVKCLLYKIQ